MRKYRRHFTYTNVVGSLALFIALGGVSWAATLPKNSVGSAQLKKNAVTAKAIKDKTITGSDIKNGTIDGSKINAGSLGAVPSADKTGNAGSVSNILPPTTKRIVASTSAASNSQEAIDTAPGTVLLKNGAVQIVAKCVIYSGGLYVYVVTNSGKDGTVASYGSAMPFYGMPFLNPGRSDYNSYFMSNTVSSNSASYIGSSAYYGIGTAVDVDGNGLQFQVHGWAKYGTIAAGDGAYGPGNVCIFASSGVKL